MFSVTHNSIEHYYSRNVHEANFICLDKRMQLLSNYNEFGAYFNQELGEGILFAIFYHYWGSNDRHSVCQQISLTVWL